MSETQIDSPPTPEQNDLSSQSKRIRFDRNSSRSASTDNKVHPVSTESQLCSNQLSSSQHRLAELSALIDTCSHVELVHLRQTIEPRLKRDFLQLLPIEISLRILSFLPLRDILRCASVSRCWCRLTADQLLWLKLCTRDILLNHGLTIGRECTTSSASNESGSAFQPPGFSALYKCTTVDHSISTECDWRLFYRSSLQTRCNWHNGGSCPPVILRAHHNHVITCLEVFKDWAITGSDDSSICIWSLTRGERLINLFGHLGGVWSLAVLSGLETPVLVSGSCDRTARVWSLDGTRWPCLTTLFGHQSTVRCLAGHRSNPNKPSDGILQDGNGQHDEGALVVTGSRDTTLRLWNALSGACIRIFQGHRGAIRCVQFCGHTVVSGSYDCTVRIWCIQTGACLRVLNGHKNRVYALLFDGSRIISASLDTTICVWNASTGQLKYTFCGHRSLTSEMAYSGAQRILVSSNADETIRVWDVETGECLHVLAGRYKHQSAVTCVQLTRYFIVSSGDDGTVKLWDRRTGAYIRDLVRLDGAGRGGVIWRIVSSEYRLVCAAGSRNGLETTKLVILHFKESADATHTHTCRTQSQPAPLPRLSQIIGAHSFPLEISQEPVSSD